MVSGEYFRGLGVSPALGRVIMIDDERARSAYVSTQLFGLTARDPVTLTLTALMLIMVASVAGYLPARRAALVDPARALKQD
jgi:ABC-type lipoprotein release transport system permease subunit